MTEDEEYCDGIPLDGPTSWNAPDDEKRRHAATEVATVLWGMKGREAIGAAQMLVEWWRDGNPPPADNVIETGKRGKMRDAS